MATKKFEDKDSTRKDSRDFKSKNTRKNNNNSSKSRNRSKKYSKKDYSSDSNTDIDSKEFRNDPNWYIADLTTMQQAMGFSFDNFIGRNVDLEIHNTTMKSGDTTVTTDELGSIASILMNPSPGYLGVGSSAKLSAVNQQGFKLYARLSSVNSKNTQYAPQDVTTLILAMGEVVSIISHIQRAFGLLWTYNIRNRNMPKKLIEATRIDPVDFYANIAQYRIRFNTLMVQANKIPFPSNIDYFSKCAQLYSDVYKDSEDDMSQMYVFAPYSTWLLDESSSPSGTVLKTTALSRNMGTLLDTLESMLNTLLTSATYNYIYSDIINFLNRPGNSASLMYYNTIPDDYVVVPVYNYAMLGQITNITTIRSPLKETPGTGYTPLNDVVPDMSNLCLTYAPKFGSSLPSLAMDRYLNFGEQDPDVLTRIENSRYTTLALGSNYDTTAKEYYATDMSLSDHYCIGINIYTSESGNVYSFASDYDIDNVSRVIPTISDFDWFPIMYEWDTSTNATVKTLMGSIGDMKHFTTINPTTMKLINELALYGLYEPRDFEYELVK